jgi:hypothetical protein
VIRSVNPQGNFPPHNYVFLSEKVFVLFKFSLRVSNTSSYHGWLSIETPIWSVKIVVPWNYKTSLTFCNLVLTHASHGSFRFWERNDRWVAGQTLGFFLLIRKHWQSAVCLQYLLLLYNSQHAKKKKKINKKKKHNNSIMVSAVL